MTSEISISSNNSSVPKVGGLPTHGYSDSSILPITGHKLNGLNYLQWSHSVFMFNSGKGKEDYLIGTTETPLKEYRKWKDLVYSRKLRDKEVEHPILPEPCRDPNPIIVPTEPVNTENSSDSISVPYNDHDIPIAQRKGVRSCTQHPISHFVSYDNLSPNGKFTILIVHVDDIILTGDDCEEMHRLKTILAKQFEIKDLGKLKYFLRMEVARSNKGISISQRNYTLDLLKETGVLGCKPANTPWTQPIKEYIIMCLESDGKAGDKVTAEKFGDVLVEDAMSKKELSLD
ncbi:hypothetical protein RJ640_016803 [Escallonia rubra]|uniref:Reverse transcriptase Ty1/copia-type domain-containing protein n=1 Tax=Escallonia rubra TaxID=112253 RepID=A0AA88RUG3_9ASTE|nr:hypothetical protein RJ640_016803 [Escallonia rubra]